MDRAGDPHSDNPAERAVMALFELLDVPGLVQGVGLGYPADDLFLLQSALGVLDDKYIALFDAYRVMEGA